MHLNLNSEMKQKIITYSCSLTIGILVFIFITRIDVVIKYTKMFIEILFPFILGFAIAFVLNNLVAWFENKVLAATRMKPRNKRILSEIIVFLVAFGFLGFLINMIIPNLFDSIRTFIENLSIYSETLYSYVQSFSKAFHISPEMYESWFESLNLQQTISNTIKNLIPEIASFSLDFIHQLMDVLIAIASAFYLLLDKEDLLLEAKKMTFSFLKKDTANYLIVLMKDAKEIFEQYIVGNLLDSLIVGIICYVGMLILNIPYAPMIGTFVGITNIIPVFGPFLGAIPVAIILFLIQPVYTAIFLVFILILQQVDGKVLKPIILGDKLGMSGLWILFSVTVGGSLFGIAGMFFGVPVFALLYASIQDLAKIKLKKKNIQIKEMQG